MYLLQITLVGESEFLEEAESDLTLVPLPATGVDLTYTVLVPRESLGSCSLGVFLVSFPAVGIDEQLRVLHIHIV